MALSLTLTYFEREMKKAIGKWLKGLPFEVETVLVLNSLTVIRKDTSQEETFSLDVHKPVSQNIFKLREHLASIGWYPKFTEPRTEFESLTLEERKALIPKYGLEQAFSMDGRPKSTLVEWTVLKIYPRTSMFLAESDRHEIMTSQVPSLEEFLEACKVHGFPVWQRWLLENRNRRIRSEV